MLEIKKENLKNMKNNEKINFWKGTKKDISIVWKTKKKWIIPIYLIVASLATIIDFRRCWSLNDLLEYFAFLLVLFPLIFLVFLCFQTKEAEIVKKARINNPKKFYKLQFVTRMFVVCFLLGFGCISYYSFTTQLGDYQRAISIILSVFISFFAFITFFWLYFLHCQELAQEKKPQNGAEPL